MGQLIYDKGRIHMEKKVVSLINGAEKIEQPPAREWKWTPVLHHTQKLT